MIASNYIKHPEALRFQREMFSNGYHNSPRIMRLMEVIFSHAAAVPQWVKEMKKKAAALVKQWKKAQIICNFTAKTPVPETDRIEGYYYGTNGEAWSGRGLKPKWIMNFIQSGGDIAQFRHATPQRTVDRFRPILTPSRGRMPVGGVYRKFCRKCNKWATASGSNYEAYSDY